MSQQPSLTRDSVEGFKVRDFINLRTVDGIYTTDQISAEAIIRSYIFTDALKQNFHFIFREIAKPRGSDRRCVLISGNRGVGKTHALSIIREIARDVNLGSTAPVPELQEPLRFLRGRRLLVLDIPCLNTGSATLRELFFTAFLDVFRKTFPNLPAPAMDHWLEIGDPQEQLEHVCAALPSDYELLVLVDDAAEKLISYQNPTRVTGDLDFLQVIARATQVLPVFLVATFFEELLIPPVEARRYKDLVERVSQYRLSESFLIRTITRRQVLELITGNVMPRIDGMRPFLENVWQSLRKTIPSFRTDLRTFLDHYPLHPTLFQLSFCLHRYVRNYSILLFTASAVSKVMGFRCTSLVTVEMLFDTLQHEISEAPELKEAYEIYRAIDQNAIQILPIHQRIVARMLLKALFLFCVTDEVPATPENLIDALLLSELDSRPITRQDVVRLLDHFVDKSSGCLEKVEESGVEEYRIATHGRGALEKAIREAAATESNLQDKVRRTLYLAFCLAAPGLRIPKESYNHPISNTLLEAPWRGTARMGAACWADRYDRIHVQAQERRASSPLADLANSATAGMESPFTNIQAFPHDLEGEDGPRTLDWQMVVLPPQEEKHASRYFEELIPRHPSLLVLQPGRLQPNEIRLAEEVTVLASEESRPRLAEFGQAVQERRTALEASLIRIVDDKYRKEGTLHSLCGATALGKIPGTTLEEAILPALESVFDALFPLHPMFPNQVPPQTDPRLLARAIMGKDLAPVETAFAQDLLVPLGLCRLEEGNRVVLDREGLRERPPAGDLLLLLQAFPRARMPILILERLLGSPPFGLQPSSRTAVLLAVVGAGKARLFQADRPELNALNRAGLSGDFDYSAFDTLQAEEERVLALPELLQWGYTLCHTRFDSAENLTVSRRHLQKLLSDWWEFEKERSRGRDIQEIPLEFLTTHVGRELQSCSRNRQAIESAAESIARGRRSLEEGLTDLALAFSNNLQAFQAVLQGIENMQEFVEGSGHLSECRQYLLCSDRTDDSEIESLRMELANFFERPGKFLDKERRGLFMRRFAAFKQAYMTLYLTQHEKQREILAEGGKLAELFGSGFWRNLPVLTRLSLVTPFPARIVNGLVSQLKDRICDLPTDEIILSQPRCSCGFGLAQAARLEDVASRLLSWAQTAREAYAAFLVSFKKTIIYEIQRIPSLDDNVARQVVNLMNCNLDDPVTLDAVKVINFILKRRTRVLPLGDLYPESPGTPVPRQDALQKLEETMRSLQESRELFLLLGGDI